MRKCFPGCKTGVDEVVKRISRIIISTEMT